MQVNPVISAETASDLRQDIFKIGASLCIFLPLCSIIATIFLYTYGSVTSFSGETLTESFLESGAYLLYSLAVSLIPIALCTILLLLTFKRKFSFYMLKPAVSAKKFTAITALGLISIIIGSLASLVTATVMDYFGLKLSSVDAPKGAAATIIFIIVHVIIAPIGEEVFFRGIILERLRRYGDVFAVLSSAMMFSLLHASLQSFPSAFICGIIFALISIYSGSPLSSIVVHAVNNALSVATILISSNASDTAANLFLITFMALFLIISITALIIIKAKAPQTFFLTFSGEVLKTSRKAGILFLSLSMMVFIFMSVISAISAAI